MREKTIFLGYAFRLDYVRPAVEAGAKGLARVVTASDILRGMPLLHKIEAQMEQADLCLFDLTTHNPNVAIEFGIAYAKKHKTGILYCTDNALNPKPGSESSVFSDLKGWDSVRYDDALDLELQLKRYLPELLSVRKPVSSDPLRVARATEGLAAIRPRLNARVSVSPPGAFAVGSGPTIKIGNYGLSFEIRNSGKGIANLVRVAATGMETVQRYQAIDVGAKAAVRFRWDLEAQSAYRTRPQFPAIIVEYEDDAGTKYEQRGTLNVRQNSDGRYLYDADGLGPPKPISNYSIPWE